MNYNTEFPTWVVAQDLDGDGKIEMNGAGTVVELSPPLLSFGAQKVGTKSAPQKVQVTNTGSTGLSITKLIDNGTNSKDFPQTSTRPSSLSAGASCTITVTFEPQKTGNPLRTD